MSLYKTISHYADDISLRESLNRLTQKIWGITVLHGGEQYYVPFSKTFNEAVVANVCVGRFNLVLNGRPFEASMIQTVLTDEDHRNQGLIRDLFLPVQRHIAETTGRAFFTAHKNMVEFYGKFGYQPFPLTDHFVLTPSTRTAATQSMVRVDLNRAEERERFESVANKRAAVSNQFGFTERNWLLFWFCHYFHRENLYWLEELQVYLIARFDDHRIDLLDIIAEHIPDWESLQTYLDLDSESEVRSYFCPDKLGCLATPVLDEEDFLFADDHFPVLENYCLPETQRG